MATAMHHQGAGIEGAARRATRPAAPWLVRLARLGYAANGAVYILVGLLAFRAAFGAGGATTDKKGALASIADEPAGAVILGVLALGLFGYAAWRLVESITDAEDYGSGAKGLAIRGAHLGTGFIFAALAVQAVRLALGAGDATGPTPGGDGVEHWTARLLALPLGRVLTIAAGVGVLGFGLAQIPRGWVTDPMKKLDVGRLDHGERQWVKRTARFGHAARGVVFTIAGWFLIQAARQFDPQEAAGMGESLTALERAPYGPWLLALVSVGLMAFGAWQFLNARYRRIRA
jgi:hypothetical protein